MELRNSFMNNEITEVKNGEIYWCDCGSVNTKEKGEQGGVRPVIIIQNNMGNKYSPTVIFASVTSKVGKYSKVPTHVLITDNIPGLKKDSMVLLEQINTLNKGRLKGYIGKVSEYTMARIKRAMDISLDNVPHIDGVNDILLITRMDKGLKTEIINTLKNIRSLERVIATTNKDKLRKLAIDERGLNLDMLDKICKENGFDYKDFYEKYNEETVEKVAIR